MDDADWKCPNVERCELFPKMHSERALRSCLDQYCLAEFQSCARFQFAKAHRRRPPITLMPSGETREPSRVGLRSP
ncbi:hypothetical protein PPSIR1_17845 [Plesiocystis pacifica SIR-1]|uniref:Uncharacterized protein n=1 Tax=Plesiocystis pacifica SIR-1 TaxID=391625 RepID=A6GIX3_9BACT|nr:hypothetical protein [Plesiocystis pacifica]EDM74170.1 hypothetical protein PPSIR1_17845 [Plesiocystis pacifica SIR-1]